MAIIDESGLFSKLIEKCYASWQVNMGLSMSLQIEQKINYLENDVTDLQNSKANAPKGIVADLIKLVGNVINFGNILKQNDSSEHAILARNKSFISIKFDIDFFLKTKLKEENNNLRRHLIEIQDALNKLQEEHIHQSQLKKNEPVIDDLSFYIQTDLDFILQIIDNYKGDKDESDKIKRKLESVEEKIMYGNLSESIRVVLHQQIHILSKYWREKVKFKDKKVNIKENKAINKNSGQYSRSNELLMASGYDNELGGGELIKEVNETTNEYEDAQVTFIELSQLSTNITNYKGEFDEFEQMTIEMKLFQEKIYTMKVDGKIKSLLNQQLQDLKNYMNEKQLNIAKYLKAYDSKGNESTGKKFNCTTSGINLTYTDESRRSRNLTMNKFCWREQ